jgi:hypothetical protein
MNKKDAIVLAVAVAACLLIAYVIYAVNGGDDGTGVPPAPAPEPTVVEPAPAPSPNPAPAPAPESCSEELPDTSGDPELIRSGL